MNRILPSGKPASPRIRRRTLITSVFGLAARFAVPLNADTQWKLIAHRGAYGKEAAENTASALEEAIRRRYFMVETDLRRSADGRIVIHHDSSFQRICGVDRPVRSTPWEEIRKLRCHPGGERPLLFSEFAALAKGRIALWLDIKEDDVDQPFLREVEETLGANGALQSAVVGINAAATPWFRGRVKTAENIQTLFYEGARKRPPAQTVLVEGLGFSLSDESARWGLRNGFEVIPFVGAGHYPGTDALSPGAAVIRRLQAAGVTTFMIDPIFEPLFRG